MKKAYHFLFLFFFNCKIIAELKALSFRENGSSWKYQEQQTVFWEDTKRFGLGPQKFEGPDIDLVN